MGQNPFQSVGQAFAAHQSGYATNPQQLQNAYPNGLSQAQSAQQAQQMFNQMASRQNKRWVFNGESLTFKEFADRIWPEECAEKTHFYLKYSGEDDV